MFTWVVDDMGPKKDLKNARRWTPTELDALADVLADPGNDNKFIATVTYFTILFLKLSIKRKYVKESSFHRLHSVVYLHVYSHV